MSGVMSRRALPANNPNRTRRQKTGAVINPGAPAPPSMQGVRRPGLPPRGAFADSEVRPPGMRPLPVGMRPPASQINPSQPTGMGFPTRPGPRMGQMPLSDSMRPMPGGGLGSVGPRPIDGSMNPRIMGTRPISSVNTTTDADIMGGAQPVGNPFANPMLGGTDNRFPRINPEANVPLTEEAMRQRAAAIFDARISQNPEQALTQLRMAAPRPSEPPMSGAPSGALATGNPFANLSSVNMTTQEDIMGSRRRPGTSFANIGNAIRQGTLGGGGVPGGSSLEAPSGLGTGAPSAFRKGGMVKAAPVKKKAGGAIAKPKAAPTKMKKGGAVAKPKAKPMPAFKKGGVVKKKAGGMIKGKK